MPETLCSHRPPCPGCPRFGETGVARAPYEQLLALCREQGLDKVPVEELTPWGYRHRARLAVRGHVRQPKIGLFQRGSHHIVDTPNCPVHHPLINHTAQALKYALKEACVPPYSDLDASGRVRYLQVVVERSSQQIQVVVVDNSDSPQGLQDCFDLLRERLGSHLHSLFWNGNARVTNAILGENWQTIHGPPAITETIGRGQVFYPPGAFGQSHLNLSERMVVAIGNRVLPDQAVAEFYAGTGPIGLHLLEQSARVQFNEVAPSSLEGLALGLDHLSPDARKKTTVASCPAGKAIHFVHDADVIVVDPPRKGIDQELIACLTELQPAARPVQLVYVSCHLSSFIRDSQELRRNWALDHVAAYVMFPFTDQIETLGIFRRKAPGEPKSSA